MKKFYLCLHMIFITILSFSQVNSVANDTNTVSRVIFDLANAVVSGNIVDVPILVNSPDTVVALDFTISYDNTKLSYLNINDLTGSKIYIDKSLANSNPVSFFSFSLNNYQYSKTLPIISIRFNMLSQLFSRNDITADLTLINGEMAISQITDFSTKSPETTKAVKTNIYPNPASIRIYVEVSENSDIQLLDMNGKIIIQTWVYADHIIALNVESLHKGLYLLKVENKNDVKTEKIIIK